MTSGLDLMKREARANSFKFLRIPNTPPDLELGELLVCLHPRIHERQVPPYGVVFCNEPIPDAELVKLIPLEDAQVDVYRQFADGRRSFLIYHSDGKPHLGTLKLAFSDEYRLLQLSNMVRGVVLQRQQSGVVKIVQRGEVYAVRGRTWSVKRFIGGAYDRIVACLGDIKIPNFGETLWGLLHISYYSLSPDGIGATLVWCLADADGDTGISLQQLGISVKDPNTYSIASHILRYHDGATLVLPTGELATTGVHLKYSSKAAENVREIRGTRHTSAARFTFDHTDTLAVVVSQDGPVTVFSDGIDVAELPIEGAKKDVEWLKRVSPASKRSDIWGRSFTMTCPSCGRYIGIEQVTVVGWKDPEEVDCPICKKKLYSAMCFSLSAYPIKYPPQKDRELTIG